MVPVLRTRLEYEVTSLWSQVTRQDSTVAILEPIEEIEHKQRNKTYLFQFPRSSCIGPVFTRKNIWTFRTESKSRYKSGVLSS